MTSMSPFEWITLALPVNLRAQWQRKLMDMRSLEATDASDGNWDKKAAQELERIARSLEGVTGLGSRALRVTVRKGK